MFERRATAILAIVLAVCLSGVRGDGTSKQKLRAVYSWKALEFAFPTEQARESAIKQGTFVPGGPVPIDVDTYYGEKNGPRVFVAIPRFQSGVPVTLGYVTARVSPEGNPIIAPYPDWQSNKIGNCDAITSVYRVQIDSCGRLWVLDTGKHEEVQICRPQLLAYSLATNKLLTRYRFPKEQFKEDSIFVTPMVDVRDHQGSCKDTFVYVADVTGFGLLVYDVVNNRSWRINNNLFYPYPPHGSFSIKGDSFDLMDGILGLSLSPYREQEDRILYFHSLASKTESWVPTSVIRNYSLFQGNPDAAGRSFRPLEDERSSQAAPEAMDRYGRMFFGLMSDLAIGCWNSRYYRYGVKNIEKVVVDEETLQFASGIKVVPSKSGPREELWVLTSSFQKYMTGTLHSNETNFRIQAAYIDELVRGTKCDLTSSDINKIQRNSKPGSFQFPQ